MATSTSQRALLFILRETVGELLYFPVWWYSLGFMNFLKSLWRRWRSVTEMLAIRILAKNMWRPMYADYTRSGRVISFFFRVLILGTRLIGLVIWTVIELVMIILWIFGPLLVLALLLRQVVPL